MNSSVATLDEALDRCLALLERGETLEGCAGRFPEHAEDLRPLLEVAVEIRRVPAPRPTAAGVTEGKRRMLEVLAQRTEGPASLAARPEQYGKQSDVALYQALDDCLASLEQEGITVEACLAGYAEHAEYAGYAELANELRPLLQVASRLQSVPRPVPSHAASVAGKRRMLEAVKQRQRPGRVVALSQALSGTWGGVRDRASSTGEALSQLSSRQWTAIRERIRSTGEALSRLFSRQWTAIREGIRPTGEALSQALSGTWAVVRDRASSTGRTLSQRLSRQWTAVRERTASDGGRSSIGGRGA